MTENILFYSFYLLLAVLPMPEIEYFTLFMILFAMWAICFLICGQSWQLIAAFVPFSLSAYLFYSDNFGWDLFLLFPILAIPIVDIHIVLSRPKFKGIVAYINYILIIPLLAIYWYFADNSNVSGTWIGTAFRHVGVCLIIIFAGKFWFSDVVLLLINRLWIRDKVSLETRINNVFITGTGKTRTFYASIYQLGNVEISGFFYQYVRFKKIGSQDKIVLKIKTGCLGTQFVSGFPKILERRL